MLAVVEAVLLRELKVLAVLVEAVKVLGLRRL
jgi:hypothetical protein